MHVAKTKKLNIFLKKLWTLFIAKSGLFFFQNLCRGEFVNEERIKQYINDGFLLVSNHVSYLDWILLWSYFYHRHHIKISFIGKESLFSHPLWSPLMDYAGVIKVSNEGDRFLDINSYKKLKESRYIGIFPEGTRNNNNQHLMEAKSGVIKLAIKLKLPIIPVGLVNFNDVWPRDRRFPRIAKCSIVFGEEFKLQKSVNDNNDIIHETRLLMKSIGKLCNLEYPY